LASLLKIGDETERKSFREKTEDAGMKLALTIPLRVVAAGTAWVSTGSAAVAGILGATSAIEVAVNYYRSRKKSKAAAAKKVEQVEKGLDPDKDPLEQLQEARQEIAGLREELAQARAGHDALESKVLDLAQKLSYTNQTAVRADRKSDASLDQISAVRTSLQGVAAQQNQFTPAVQAMIDEAVARAVAQTNETWQRGLAGQVGARLDGMDARVHQLETGQIVQQTVPSQPPQQPPPAQPEKKQSWLDRFRGRAPEPPPVQQQQQPQQQPQPRPVYPGMDSQAGMPAPDWQNFHGAEPRPQTQQPSQTGEPPKLGQGPLASPHNTAKPGNGPTIR
jgi:hypothetical protein